MWSSEKAEVVHFDESNSSVFTFMSCVFFQLWFILKLLFNYRNTISWELILSINHEPKAMHWVALNIVCDTAASPVRFEAAVVSPVTDDTGNLPPRDWRNKADTVIEKILYLRVLFDFLLWVPWLKRQNMVFYHAGSWSKISVAELFIGIATGKGSCTCFRYFTKITKICVR